MSRLRNWTVDDPRWNALGPYERAALMSLMEAGGGQNSINVLGAMVNRSQRLKQNIGDHAGKSWYQPTLEPAQQARMERLLKHKDFPMLVEWAKKREAGQVPDPVNGATHFLVHEKTMKSLRDKDPDKYHNWGPFPNSRGVPGKNWTGYDPATNSYRGVITRDGTHAFLAPDGAYSAPYQGKSTTQLASNDQIGKLITDLEAEGKTPDAALVAQAMKDNPAGAPGAPQSPTPGTGPSAEDRARLAALSGQAARPDVPPQGDPIGDLLANMAKGFGGQQPAVGQAENAGHKSGRMLAEALRSFGKAPEFKFRPLAERTMPLPEIDVDEGGKPITYRFMPR